MSLYTKMTITQVISVEFSKNELDMSNYFMCYSNNHIEGKCRKEGFIRPRTTRIISYSAPIVKENYCLYNVDYECDICNPNLDVIYDCKIMKLAKIGIRAVISNHNNPIVFYVSREHNPNVNFDDYKEGDQIRVKIIGKRFQLNDPYIEVIGVVV